jgi:predicted nucleic acid-binding protein
VLLTAAEDNFYHPLWSTNVLNEMERAIIRIAACTPQQLLHLRKHMNEAFPEALVSGYEPRIPAMTNDPKDRHVLAAAVHSSAGIIVTENLRHFTQSTTTPHHVVAMSVDNFLCDLLDFDPERFVAMLVALSRERRGGDIIMLLERIYPIAPRVARLVAFYLDISAPGRQG